MEKWIKVWQPPWGPATPQEGRTGMQLSEDQWKQRLTPLEFNVLRKAATERPGTGKLLHEAREGEYSCKGCGAPLFKADAKFDSGCGWPSFYEPHPGAVVEDVDYHLGYPRTEIRCAHCDSHLGHVFEDAPQTPTGLRYCMNSAALSFQPEHG